MGMAEVSEHYTLDAEEAEARWFIGCLATLKGVGAQTGGKLSAVEFTRPPGFATPRHVHHDADEAFYVLEGSLRGFCGDQTWRATKGGFVWLPRGIPHGYAVDGAETLRTLAITVPAGFDQFVADASDPTETRTLPPPGEPDIPKLLASGDKHNIETLGPPDF
jgi:quercetin dioxygenase-like cupin family protein